MSSPSHAPIPSARIVRPATGYSITDPVANDLERTKHLFVNGDFLSLNYGIGIDAQLRNPVSVTYGLGHAETVELSAVLIYPEIA